MASPPTPPDVPSIAVDAPSTPDLHQHEQHIPEIAVSSGSTDDLLPPSTSGAAPPSPTADSPTNASSDLPPPSPTLSARSLASSAPSVHFAPQHTTLDLRDNRPSDLDGKSSLGLLSLPQPSHRRRGSAATTSSAYTATTVADGSDIGLVPLSSSPSPSPSPGPLSDAGSTLASPTRTHVSDDAEDEFSSRASLNKKHRHASSSPSPSPSPSPAPRGDANEDGGAGGSQKKAELARPEHLDLAQETDVDPAPFGAKPLQLANLVDPKSIEALEALGGVEGLLHALGTHPMRGLEDDTGVVAGVGEGESSPRISNDTRKPSITLTAPGVDDSTSARVPSLHGSRSSSSSHLGSSNTDPYRASVADRVRVFGANVLPVRKSKSIWALMWAALTDKLLIVLSIAAVVSLALGFFQDFGPAHKPGDPQVDWVEGVAIIVAILVVVLVGSLNDYQKEKQFQVLNAKKDERAVKVIRAGVEALVSVYDVVVGDVALLEPGEIVPCDGVFLRGHNVRCDESGATGESDAIKKATFDECVRVRDERLASYRGRGRSGSSKDADGEDDEDGVDKDDKPSGMELLGHTDCFIVSGSRVLEGVGAYVIIAVGTRSFNGRIMMALRGDAEDTPLQQKLNSLADAIAWAGTTVGIILFVGLMIRFFVEIGTGVPPRTPSEKGIAFVDILIISVTLVVVAVPEGLPLAVTLALAFATKRMTAENLLVRVLGSCETMANASVVCTDKTGTLTQNEMAVVAGSIGIHAKFVRQLDENRARAAVGDRIEGAGGSGKGDDDAAGKNARARKHAEDWSLDLASLSSALPPQLSTLLNASIAVNSTAFFDAEADAFVGSKTEIALLKMVKELGWEDYRVVRERAEVVQVVPFSSERKAMGVVVKNGSRGARIFVKGASEILTERCARHVVVRKDDNDGGGKGREVDGGEVESAVMGELDRDNIERTITFYAGQTLRTIALCYRDFESWPPEGCTVEDGEVPYDEIARDMTLIGITGIEDPLRPGVREAVANCALAGVQVKMCTGDNVLTARSIAQQCGIYSPGGIVMEGPHFRNLPDSVRAQIVPRLQVLARSSPEDKKILVESLKNLGEIVGVTGDGTNDGPALKTANVGFSMGIAGTEVAKEASDIILMDDNFASIVKAIMWGRAVNDAVRKFLQFQISTNVTAVVITIVSGLASANEDPVLTAVQLLWVNIIMDTFAALALATDPASPALLDRKPDRKWAPLFSVDMLKQIVGQSIYQTAIILIFHFLGARILGFGTNEQDRRVTTLVFNAFVFAQIFNSLNCRRLDRKFNIFEGLTRNWFFIGITLIEVGAQVLIVFVGKSAFSVTRIAGREWGISLALGFVSIPLGALIRLVPNEPCKRVFAFFRLYREPPLLPTTAPDTPEPGLGFALDMLRDNLGAFRRVRGGRLRSSSFVVKSMSGVKGRRGDEEGVVPGLLAMLPSLVGAHIVGSNWAGNAHGLADPAGFDPSKSSAALWENRFEVHPDTPADDPVFRLLKQTGGRRT